jgi:hypothetical protein
MHPFSRRAAPAARTDQHPCKSKNIEFYLKIYLEYIHFRAERRLRRAPISAHVNRKISNFISKII